MGTSYEQVDDMLIVSTNDPEQISQIRELKEMRPDAVQIFQELTGTAPMIAFVL